VSTIRTLPVGGGAVIPAAYCSTLARVWRAQLRRDGVHRPSPEVTALLESLEAAGRTGRRTEGLSFSESDLGRARFPTDTPTSTMPAHPRSLSSGAVADRLGVTVQRVRQRCAAGHWPSATLGVHGWEVSEADLLEKSA
jgi:hypothetical protein